METNTQIEMDAGAKPARETRSGDVKAPMIEIPVAGPWPFIPGWFREKVLRQAKGARLSVLLDFVSRANTKGISWPSVGAQCKSTGYGFRAVKQARAFWVSAGVIRGHWERTKQGRWGRRNFQLVWAEPWDPDRDHGNRDHG